MHMEKKQEKLPEYSASKHKTPKVKDSSQKSDLNQPIMTESSKNNPSTLTKVKDKTLKNEEPRDMEEK